MTVDTSSMERASLGKNFKRRKPVVARNTSEASWERIVSVPVVDGFADGDHRVDLLRDLFFCNYKSDPKVIESPPKDRRVNKIVIDWMMKNGFDNHASQGNLAASVGATSSLFHYLMSDEAIRNMVDIQEEKPPQPAQPNPDNNDDNGNQSDESCAGSNGGDPGEEQSEDELEQAIKEIEDKLNNNPFASALAHQANREASDNAEKINSVMKAWGISEGDYTSDTDVDNILQMANNGRVQDLAKLIGRAENTAQDEMLDVARHNISQVVEATYTHDLEYVTEEQKMLLFSPDEHVALVTFAQYVDSGLFGFVPTEEIQRKPGNSLFYLDGSGSMDRKGVETEKGIAMGVAEATRLLDEDRYYEICEFSGHGQLRRVTSDEDWKAHIEFCKKSFIQGTDFNGAFEDAMDRIEEIHKRDRIGVDLTFSSDGMACLSTGNATRFRDMKDRLGVKLIYLKFGYFGGDESVASLADKIIQLPDAYSVSTEDVIRTISKFVAEQYVNGYGLGD